MNLDKAALLLLEGQAFGGALPLQQQRLQILSREQDFLKSSREQLPRLPWATTVAASTAAASTSTYPPLSSLLSSLRDQQHHHHRPSLALTGETASSHRPSQAAAAQLLQAILLRREVERLLLDRANLQRLELLKQPLTTTIKRGATAAAATTTTSTSCSLAELKSLAAAVSPNVGPVHSPVAVSAIDNSQQVIIAGRPAKRIKVDVNATIDRDTSISPSQSSVNAKKDVKWLSSLEKLKEYKKIHGDCIVPRGYSHDPRLASWVAEQRKQYKLMQDGKPTSITPERVALLEELDFSWNAQETAWSRHLADLKKFRGQTGHCHVPLNHPEFPKLGLWVKEQRRHYTLLKQNKPSHMTEERANELDRIGFCWDTHEATWLDRFRELVAFKEKHGNCLVPTNFAENPKLGTWTHHQRRQYKKFKEGKACHITQERIRALDSLGFVWSTRDNNSNGNNKNDSYSDSESDDDLSSLDFRPGSLSFRPRKRQRNQAC